ncbi:LOW QUALITY PROTEIN: hypothetical protein Cgig2_025353 [Carnegiea gigantea]|uniref:Uncharacterized protein n=1 Tax=Carnegiea gigantea TaxID=171969 RepID=A0A9Q1GK37_9CARY|nr:LOW QUALITY PROTEIN: hypothetical protein Cgig2_025353 [Carnegiea gigantea]
MSTIADAITRQVSEQVKRVMEVVGPAKPPLPLEYPLVHEGEPSHRPEGIPSLRPMECSREVARLDRSDRFPTRRRRGHAAVEPVGRSARGTTAVSTTASTPYATHSRRTVWLEEQEQTSQPGHPMLRRPPPMAVPPDLRMPGSIVNSTSRAGIPRPNALAPPPPRDEECSTEVVATIAAWKAQLRSAQQVHIVEQGPCLTAPTMVFGGKDAPRFASPQNDPLVVEMKIASAIVRRIRVDTGSFVDIITWDCLKRVAHPGRDIILTVNPILGFRGQEVNPTEMIRLPVRFGDKTKFKSLEIDFLLTYPRPVTDYMSGSPLSSCSSSLDAPASASKGLVALSSVASPSDEGGINSTSSGSRPFAADRLRLFTKHRPQNTSCPQIRPQGLARPYGGIQGCRSGLAGSLAPWLGPHQRRPSPADAAALSSQSRGPLGPPVASHSVSGIGRRAPLAPALRDSLHPLGQRPQPWLSPPRTPLGGPKSQRPPSPRI